MVMLDFDTDDVEVQASYAPIPDGKYACQITACEAKPTAAGNGMRLLVTLKVVDGQYAGRTCLWGLNVKNANPVAQEIGRKQLRQLLIAIGMDGERDMANIIGAEVGANVVVRPATEKWDASNDVKSVFQVSDAAPEKQEQAKPGPGKKKPAFLR